MVKEVAYGRGKIDLYFDGGEVRWGRNLLKLVGFERAEERDYRDLAITNGALIFMKLCEVYCVGWDLSFQKTSFGAKSLKVPIPLRTRRNRE
jgi:hypothetical protein